MAVDPEIRAQSDGRSKTRLVLFDQATVSAANFATGLLLARFLGAEGYGLYVLANGVILFVAVIQMALVISPMMVIGPTIAKQESDSYYRQTTIQQVVFCVAVVLVTAVGGWIAACANPALGIGAILWPLAFAMSGFLTQDFLRRQLLSQDRAYRALVIDVVAYGLRLAVLVIFGIFVGLDAAAALWISAATTWAASVLPLLRKERRARRSFPEAVNFSVGERHWNFGKWLLASNLAYWIATQSTLYVAAAILGVASTGAIAAAMNVVAIAHVLFLAMENFVPSRAARAYASNGVAQLGRYLRRISLLGGLATLAIVLLAAAGADYWLELFYGNQYAGHGWIVYWWGLYYLLSFFQRPLSTGLKVLNDTRGIFFSSLGAAIVNILLMPLAVSSQGLQGAMFSLCLSLAVMVCLLWVFYRRTRQKHAPAVSSSSPLSVTVPMDVGAAR